MTNVSLSLCCCNLSSRERERERERERKNVCFVGEKREDNFFFLKRERGLSIL